MDLVVYLILGIGLLILYFDMVFKFYRMSAEVKYLKEKVDQIHDKMFENNIGK